jgi:hypothetical protein
MLNCIFKNRFKPHILKSQTQTTNYDKLTVIKLLLASLGMARSLWGRRESIKLLLLKALTLRLCLVCGMIIPLEKRIICLPNVTLKLEVQLKKKKKE